MVQDSTPGNSVASLLRVPRGPRVRFWGVRGSIPTPGFDTARFGGNTSCVTVEAERAPQGRSEATEFPGDPGAAPEGEAPGTAGSTELFVLDAGSGLRLLGLDLLRHKRLPIRAHLLLTHTHWDHIQGFPFFAPAFIPGNEITVYGAAGSEEDIQTALAGQMLHRYFPVSLEQLGATLRFAAVQPGTREVGPARVTVAPLNHPGKTVGYRLEVGGCSVAYVTDCEPLGSLPDLEMDPAVLDLARDADVLIHDAQYTDAEYSTKVGWGHSPVGYVVDVALAARAKRLVLFHHDPLRVDTQLDALVEAARERAVAAGGALVVEAAMEGTTLELGGERAEPPTQLVAAG